MASPPDGSGPLAPPPVTVTFMVILITFFILGMLSICFCRCCSQHLWSGHPAGAAGGAAARNGLDPVVIRSFPTLVYSNVKHLRRENYELECAICLLEFEGESVLRLLTACYHVFHQECIDLWLESHKSCPVCRGNLDLSPEKIQEKLPAALHENNNMPGIQEHSETFFEDAISIEIEDDEEEKGTRSSERTATTSTVPRSINKLPRWNSTGHSIVKDRSSSGCRYTLRLPDNVRVRVSKGHSGSCITFGSLGVRSHVALDELPGCSKGKAGSESSQAVVTVRGTQQCTFYIDEVVEFTSQKEAH